MIVSHYLQISDRDDYIEKERVKKEKEQKEREQELRRQNAATLVRSFLRHVI